MFKRSSFLTAVLGGVLAFSGMSFAATGYLDTPDRCMTLEKVINNDIYLKRGSACEGVPGRQIIEATIGEKRRIFVDGVFWSEQAVHPMGVSDVVGLADKAMDIGELKLPVNRYEKEMQVEAEKTKAVFDSPAFQARLKAETERAGEALIGDKFAEYYKDSSAVADAVLGKLGQDERLYVFISSSMPLPVIRTYMADIGRMKDPRISVVLRGFKDGMDKIGPTVSFVADVLKQDASCDLSTGGTCAMWPVDLIVDPLLYRRYRISQVPAFVYARGINFTNPGMSEGEDKNAEVGEFFLISGDADLKYVLQRLGDASGNRQLATAVSR